MTINDKKTKPNLDQNCSQWKLVQKFHFKHLFPPVLTAADPKPPKPTKPTKPVTKPDGDGDNDGPAKTKTACMKVICSNTNTNNTQIKVKMSLGGMGR